MRRLSLWLVIPVCACRAGFDVSGEQGPDPDAAPTADALPVDVCANTPPAEALALYYTFDDDPILGVPDDSGNDLDGVCDGLRCPDLTEGRRASAYDFIGDRADRIIIRAFGSQSLELTSGFSISLWVSARRTLGLIIAKTLQSASTADAASFALRLDDSARLIFESEDGVGVRHTLASEPIPHGWHHIVATFNGDAKALFVDGERVASAAAAAYIAFDGSDAVIGGNDTAPSFDGTLDELRIYEGSLDDAAVVATRDCL